MLAVSLQLPRSPSAPMQQGFRMTVRLGVSNQEKVGGSGQRASANPKEASFSPCDPES